MANVKSIFKSLSFKNVSGQLMDTERPTVVFCQEHSGQAVVSRSRDGWSGFEVKLPQPFTVPHEYNIQVAARFKIMLPVHPDSDKQFEVRLRPSEKMVQYRVEALMYVLPGKRGSYGVCIELRNLRQGHMHLQSDVVIGYLDLVEVHKGQLMQVSEEAFELAERAQGRIEA